MLIVEALMAGDDEDVDEAVKAIELLEDMAGGWPELAQEDEREVSPEYFANLKEDDLKREVHELVLSFDWSEWLDYERIQLLLQNIDVFESMKRTKMKVALTERKRRKTEAQLE